MNQPVATQIRKAYRVRGKTLVLRNAEVKDAEFILSLRTDGRKAMYLTQTSPELQRQIEWLKGYAEKTDQAYFIIESQAGAPLGTVRLYDPQGDSFCWGSWVLAADAPGAAAIESALMVYAYATEHLGFQASHFDVRKGNERVWRFHERFGAVRVAASDLDYFYQIAREKILLARTRYKKYLPESVEVEQQYEH